MQTHLHFGKHGRLTVVLFLCVTLIAGCTHTREVGYERGYGVSQATPEELSRFLTGQEATVTLRDSRRMAGTVVSVSSDTVRFRTGEADSSLPLVMIKEIHVAGTFWGPVIGLVGGGLAGGLIGGVVMQKGRNSRGGGLGSIGETMGALIGGAAGSALGVLIGANVTAGSRYIIPSGGIHLRKTADTITVQVARILEENEFSITIPWNNWRTTLPKSEIVIQRNAGGVSIRVPRALLYEDGTPRYFDDR